MSVNTQLLDYLLPRVRNRVTDEDLSRIDNKIVQIKKVISAHDQEREMAHQDARRVLSAIR